MMGGRVAEELVFNTQTTGAASDIKQATDLARRLVCDFGMTAELGPLSYGQKDEQIFLGREISHHRDYSDKTAEEIDTLMRRIIDEQLQRARKILTENNDKLKILAEALLEHELLDREEINHELSGEVLEIAKKTRTVQPRKEPERHVSENGEKSGDKPETVSVKQTPEGDNSAASGKS